MGNDYNVLVFRSLRYVFKVGFRSQAFSIQLDKINNYQNLIYSVRDADIINQFTQKSADLRLSFNLACAPIVHDQIDHKIALNNIP